jgi:type II secretory pathway predicted ATPase ExeA
MCCITSSGSRNGSLSLNMETRNTLHSPNRPFSPIFDCKSRRCSNCLNKLKDSIDKRRGLILAIGEDGVGKTILCQELAKEFAEDHTIESLLILEPHFQTEKEFASCLGQLFGSFSPKADDSDNQFIEEIKKYLFTQCTAQKKSMLILINRGDELSDFCWRFFEELYKNYSDARKLLQVVIFGSPKLKETVVSFPGLSENVNDCYSVEPMTMSEARQLIRLWRQHAGQAGSGEISITLSAQWLIYLAAQGYPGRILDLCDLIRLTLSLHNTRKADWYIAQMCARMLYPGRAARLQRIRLASLTAVLAITVVYGLNTDMIARPVIGPENKSAAPIIRQSSTPQPAMQQKSSTSAPSPEMASAPPSAAQTPPDMSTRDRKTENRAGKPAHPEEQPTVERALGSSEDVGEKQPVEPFHTEEITEQPPTVQEETVDAIEEEDPVIPLGPTEILGTITVRQKETLYDMTRKLYGPYQGDQQQTRTAAVLRFNPALSSASRIQIGDSIRFPALPVMLPPDADKQWWLRLAAFADLGEAYRFVRRHANTPPLLIIPTVESKGELRFTILLQEYFTDEDSARKTGNMSGQKNHPSPAGNLPPLPLPRCGGSSLQVAIKHFLPDSRQAPCRLMESPRNILRPRASSPLMLSA